MTSLSHGAWSKLPLHAIHFFHVEVYQSNLYGMLTSRRQAWLTKFVWFARSGRGNAKKSAPCPTEYAEQ